MMTQTDVGVPPDPKRPTIIDGALCCSFCYKPQHAVAKLVAGPEVYICINCVEIAMAACYPKEMQAMGMINDWHAEEVRDDII